MQNITNMPSDDVPLSEKKYIRYEKCIGCPDIGTRCGAGNLLNMPISELIQWLRLWRSWAGLTYKECATAWDTPYSTTVRILTEDDADFKYTTMHHIVSNVVRYGLSKDQELSDNPCPATSSEIEKQTREMEGKLHRKEEECARLAEELTEKNSASESTIASKDRTLDFLVDLTRQQREDIVEKNRVMNLRRVEVASLNDTIASLQSQRVDDMREAESRYDSLRLEYRDYRRHSRRMRWILGVSLVAIVIILSCYIVWDFAHDGVGIFW